MDKNNEQLSLFDIDIEQTAKGDSLIAEKKKDGSRFSKYIVYVDESRDYSLTAVDENYHVLLFVFFINDIIQSRLFLR